MFGINKQLFDNYPLFDYTKWFLSNHYFKTYSTKTSLIEIRRSLKLKKNKNKIKSFDVFFFLEGKPLNNIL